MKSIRILKNTIQPYAWGSPTAIPELLGTAATGEPQAELWMGAHPKSPSMIRTDGEEVSLLKEIEEHPEETLGSRVVETFGNRLPYLFKVLAAAEPLSIQAHPSLEQAREGFARENGMEIPFDAPERNYRDGNHKPECICALTSFWALNGFRKIPDILSLTEKICPAGLAAERDALEKQSNPEGLKTFFHTLMTIPPKRQTRIIAEAVENARELADGNPAFNWIGKLYEAYPSDIGVISPLFLNLICLEPGHAMFLPAGQLHSYLDGVGIEIMANSDNVLRGGLTPKHVDVPELLRVLDFDPQPLEVLTPEKISHAEWVYPSRAEEFVLSVMSVLEEMGDLSFDNESIKIFLCTTGTVSFSVPGESGVVTIEKGGSVVIPADVRSYRIRGNATIYKAAVNV